MIEAVTKKISEGGCRGRWRRLTSANDDKVKCIHLSVVVLDVNFDVVDVYCSLLENG